MKSHSLWLSTLSVDDLPYGRNKRWPYLLSCDILRLRTDSIVLLQSKRITYRRWFCSPRGWVRRRRHDPWLTGLAATVRFSWWVQDRSEHSNTSEPALVAERNVLWQSYWVIQQCYNIHVTTLQSNTTQFNKWHCALLLVSIHNNNNNKLQLGWYPVGVVILHVYKIWHWLLLNWSREGYMRSM
jgi:hypothetical protein